MGLIVGAPAATAVGTANQVVAARGRNGALYLRTFAQGVWGGWQNIGGILSAAPAECVEFRDRALLVV